MYEPVSRLVVRVESAAPQTLHMSAVSVESAPDYLLESECPMRGRYFTARHVRELADRVSERDLEVFERVRSLRFVTGAQLTRLCFDLSDDTTGNARASRRALLRLTRLGVLERLPRQIGGVRAGSAGFVYRLGLGGHRLAVMRGLQPERQRRRSFVPGTLFLAHTLAIAELHTRLIESERSGRFELLELTAEPSCHRTYGGLGCQRLTLKPDSFARLGIGEFEDSYFIEVDRGTEGSRALEAQLARYLAYAASGDAQAGGGVLPKTLWLANTPERAAVIAELVRRLPASDQELFNVALFDDAITVMAGENPLQYSENEAKQHGHDITRMI